MPRQTKTISEKSTKQDILLAYQELMTQTENKTLSQTTISQIEKTNKQLLTEVADVFTTLQEALANALQDLKIRFNTVETALDSRHVPN